VVVRTAVAVVCSLVLARLAAAQPVPDATPAVAPQAEPVAPTVDARDDAGWRLYHDAFDALMNGKRAHARELASRLIRSYPGHPAIKLVDGAGIGDAPGQADTPKPPEGPIVEKPSRGARAELALFQTLHGVYAGVELCILAECDSGEAFFGLALAGGAAGALISVNVGDITSGQRALLNSGTVWGAANAGLLLIASNSDDAQTIGGSLLIGQGLGLFAGAGLFGSHVTAGQVALANSGGEWGGVLTALAYIALEDSPSDRNFSLTLLGAIDAGIAVGAYLASRFPRVSRAQTLVVDAGGIAGAVAGGSLGVLISSDFDDRSTPGLAAVGAAVGLATAAYFTRNWGTSNDASAVEAFIRPVEHARGGVAGVGFAW